MILIAHRGNINGKIPEKENTPQYIQEAAEMGYHVEIDAWGDDKGKLYLGHDQSQYPVTINFLSQGPFIVHAKNNLAIPLLEYHNLHWFWHNTDNYTITSKGWVWAYPNMPAAGLNCIAVLPECHGTSVDKFAGICSDYIERYK